MSLGTCAAFRGCISTLTRLLRPRLVRRRGWSRPAVVVTWMEELIGGPPTAGSPGTRLYLSGPDGPRILPALLRNRSGRPRAFQ